MPLLFRSPFWKSAPDTVASTETLDERIFAHAPPAVHALLAEAGAQLSASEFKYWMRAQVGRATRVRARVSAWACT